MNEISQIKNIDSAIQKTNSVNNINKSQMLPSTTASSAAQFLDQLLPKTAKIASPEQVLIEEIKKRHLNTMNSNLNFDALSAGRLSPEDFLSLQKDVLNANVNVDVVSKLASLLSTSITKLISMQ